MLNDTLLLKLYILYFNKLIFCVVILRNIIKYCLILRYYFYSTLLTVPSWLIDYYLIIIIIYYIFIICFEIGKFRSIDCLTYWQIERIIIYLCDANCETDLRNCLKYSALLWQNLVPPVRWHKVSNAVTYNIGTSISQILYSLIN